MSWSVDLHAVHARVGANFTFGHRAAGTVATLSDVGAPLGMTADEVGLFELDGRVLSSSSIREALATGDLTWPHTALGRRYGVDGEVVAGAGRGKGLGYPTANLRTWPRLLLPGQGIYAGVAELQDGSRYLAAIDVGTNPTFGTEPLHVEAFLLDFADDELRGDTLTVEFWERLRDEVKFDSVDDLVAAIADDVERTRTVVTLGGRSGGRMPEREPIRSRSASRAMNINGIVTLVRWSNPFPGRTTSLTKIAESPTLAPAAPTAGLASSRSSGSRASAGASATKPSVPAPPPITGGEIVHVVHPRLTYRLAGRREVRAAIAAEQSRPRSWRDPRARSSAGPTPARGPSRRSSADANATVHPPSARNPAVMTCGSVASRAASPLMCSCRTWYSSCRRCASSQAAVKAAGPRIPQAAPRRPDLPTSPS